MKRNKRIKQKMVVIGAFIVGILISIYVKTLDPSKVYISLDEKREIQNEIRLTQNEITRLKNSLSNQKKILEEYEKVYKDENSIKSVKDLLNEELNNLKIISGYSDVYGQGIILKISDSESDLKNGQNPNDLIIHDIDILRILNDLKKVGAEAISINGERVLPSSKIKCSGATITVNDTTYGQPFVIRAIGNIEMLKAVVISPDSYTTLLKDVYGINVKIEQENSLLIKKYEKYL